MQTTNRDYQIHLLHANGNQSIHAWFTREDAEKEVYRLKKEKQDAGNEITCCFEISKEWGA